MNKQKAVKPNQGPIDVAAIRAAAKKFVDDGAVASGYKGNREEIIQMLNEALATELGIKILAAIAFWIVGRWLIGKVVGLIQAGMNRNSIDPTLTKYLGSIENDEQILAAHRKFQPIIEYAPESASSRDFKRLAKSVEQMPRVGDFAGGMQFFVERLVRFQA